MTDNPTSRRTATRTYRCAALLALVVLAVAAACGPAKPPPPPPPTTTTSTSTSTTTTTAPNGQRPPWAPAHFAIGAAAQPPELQPSGWVGASGIPFDYTYQYLAAGVNTGNGWQTWNTNAQFPLWYARDAHSRGAIPVFPYYMLLQSTGPCDACGEAQQDLAHLNSATLMAAYYADFAKLMQRLGAGTYDGITGYGGTAIVHVEPDLSGYAQQAVLDNANCYSFCTGSGNDPSLLKASVASSGYSAVSAYPNTFRGFNLALLHLRDLYAPNVKLAFHVSLWATGPDIGSSTFTSDDPVALGAKAGTFANLSGVSSAPQGTSTYDIVFNDVADRDAGYYKYVVGRPNVWWDKRNVALPNFQRFEQYIDAVRDTTNHWVMIWQIPLGNQYFQTENNTDGHYQDNRAEYFFNHVQELLNNGVIGLLFGRGNAGSTTNTNDKNDGITNPASFCTTDGTSSGQTCNNHQSTVSDDDGGYLRMAATSYYTAPVALP